MTLPVLLTAREAAICVLAFVTGEVVAVLAWCAVERWA